MYGKSHLLVWKEIAQYLDKNNFNVSMLLKEQSPFIMEFQNTSVNVLTIPGMNQSLQDKYENEIMQGNLSISQTLERLYNILSFTKTQPGYFEFIKNEKYDLLLTEAVPHLHVLARILEIKNIINLVTYTNDPIICEFLGSVPYHSTTKTFFEKDLFRRAPSLGMDTFQFKGRFKNFLTLLITKIGIIDAMGLSKMRDLLAPEYLKYNEIKMMSNLTLVYGIEGLMENFAIPPNMQYVYPLTNGGETKEDQGFDDQVTDFLFKYPRVILISFGSTYIPEVETVRSLYKFTEAQKQYGFIMTLNEDHFQEGILSPIVNQPNLLTRKWIPQKQLLESKNVILFITHGGKNGFLEAVEAKKPMFTIPSANSDQKRNCEVVQEKQIGFCLTKPSFQDLQEAFGSLEANNFFKDNVETLGAVLQMKKAGKRDVLYWINYMFEVGTQHITPDYYSEKSPYFRHDLDMHFVLYIIFISFVAFLFGLLRILLKIRFSYRSFFLVLFCLIYCLATNLNAHSIQIEAIKQKKILIYPVFGDSNIVKMLDAANYLSESNYEVSMLYVSESKFIETAKQEGTKVKFFEIPTITEKKLSPSFSSEQKGLDGIFKEQADEIYEVFVVCKDVIEILKHQKFDMMIIEGFPGQVTIAPYLEISTIVRIFFGPIEPIFNEMAGGGPSHSQEMVLSKSFIFGLSPKNSITEITFIDRFKNYASQIIMRGPLRYFQNNQVKTAFPPEYHPNANPYPFNLTLMFGVEGLQLPIASPPNIKFIYPFKHEKKAKNKIHILEGDLKEFVDKYEKIIVIAFGSTFIPSNESLSEVFNFVASTKDYAFVIAVKQEFYRTDIFNILKQKNNVYQARWVPQEALLNQEKTKIFLTDGAYNSYLESVESKTAMLVLPSHDFDQKFICELTQIKSVGQCLVDGTATEIMEKVMGIAQNNYYEKNLASLSKLLKHKKTDEFDLKYWIDYGFQVGYQHLLPKQYVPMSTFSYFDLDVHFTFFTVIFVLMVSIYKIIHALLWYLCKFAKYIAVRETKEKKD